MTRKAAGPCSSEDSVDRLRIVVDPAHYHGSEVSSAGSTREAGVPARGSGWWPWIVVGLEALVDKW